MLRFCSLRIRASPFFKTLMGAMRATVVRALPNGKGKLVPPRFPDYRIQLQGLDRPAA